MLSRGPRFRMPSWMLRDHALSASGLLVREIGGNPVNTYQPDGVWEEASFGKKSYNHDKGEKLYRRSLYTFWRRTIPPPMMATFDAPSREACSVRRGRTNTPLQALALMNDTLVGEAARHLADRVAGAATGAGRIDLAFARVLGRRPRAIERQLLMASYQRSPVRFAAHPALGKQLLAVGESKSPDPGDVAAAAALVTTCHVILNLDEAVTRE